MQVKLVGSGITKPKVLSIWDHCGRSHRQCCKGKEDVRQDRVAQQLFGMINQVGCRLAHFAEVDQPTSKAFQPRQRMNSSLGAALLSGVAGRQQL